jgi:hypothetical protein
MGPLKSAFGNFVYRADRAGDLYFGLRLIGGFDVVLLPSSPLAVPIATSRVTSELEMVFVGMLLRL